MWLKVIKFSFYNNIPLRVHAFWWVIFGASLLVKWNTIATIAMWAYGAHLVILALPTIAYAVKHGPRQALEALWAYEGVNLIKLFEGGINPATKSQWTEDELALDVCRALYEKYGFVITKDRWADIRAGKR